LYITLPKEDLTTQKRKGIDILRIKGGQGQFGVEKIKGSFNRDPRTFW